MQEHQDRDDVEAVAVTPAAVAAAPVAAVEAAAPLHRHVLRLQQTVGNRGTTRAIRSLQREPVTSGL